MSNEFNNYMSNFDSYNKILVYKFNNISGGLGDLTKFFMYLLYICIKEKYKLYYLNTNNPINKYLKVNNKLYIESKELVNTKNIVNEFDIYNLIPNIYYIVEPFVLYSSFSYDFLTINFNNIFYFDYEILVNSKKIISDENYNYISIHLRLGDTYLETDSKFIPCYGEKRNYNEDNIYKFIENNDNNIIFMCENSDYRNKIKKLFKKIKITDFNIGHTGLINTTNIQIKDTITEYYILTNSSHIYAASISGFSITASKFNGIPLTNI